MPVCVCMCIVLGKTLTKSGLYYLKTVTRFSESIVGYVSNGTLHHSTTSASSSKSIYMQTHWAMCIRRLIRFGVFVCTFWIIHRCDVMWCAIPICNCHVGFSEFFPHFDCDCGQSKVGLIIKTEYQMIMQLHSHTKQIEREREKNS